MQNNLKIAYLKKHLMIHFLSTYCYFLGKRPKQYKKIFYLLRRGLRFEHYTDSRRVIYSDYLLLKAGPLKMSTNDGGSRDDQYYVTSYTEVCIIIRYLPLKLQSDPEHFHS